MTGAARHSHCGAGPESSASEQIAAAAADRDQAESVYLLLEHLAANRGVRMVEATNPGQTAFSQK